MPKPTFERLPEVKREAFVQAALEEFTDHSYDQASISRMVATLKIAKGSVYQYFDDKFDLFEWLVHEAGRRKLEVLGQGEAATDQALVPSLTRLYRSGLVFWRREPRWARLGLRVIEPSVEPKMAALRRQQQAATHQFLLDQLTLARIRGELRPGLDLPVVAWLLTGLLSEGLLRAFLDAAKTDPDALPHGPLALADEDLERIVGQALEILSSGLLLHA